MDFHKKFCCPAFFVSVDDLHMMKGDHINVCAAKAGISEQLGASRIPEIRNIQIHHDRMEKNHEGRFKNNQIISAKRS